MEQEMIQAQTAGDAEIFSLFADLDDPMLVPAQQDAADRVRMAAAFAEIASDLYLSVNTVRTHQRHLYQKLGAHSRTQAVEQARALGLPASTARPTIK
jgi:DNA-binding CsgD family transcriptional regulator